MTDEDPVWRPLADGPFSPAVAWLLRLSGVAGYAAAILYFVMDFEAPLMAVVGLVIVTGLLSLLPSFIDMFERSRERHDD